MKDDANRFRINWVKFGIGAGISAVVAFFAFLVWFAVWVTHVDNHEFGFAFNRMTGQIEPLEKKGWVVRTPWWYAVHTVDTRPYQVQISANNRILNAKLVQFNPTGLDTFVAWHGRSAGDNLENLKEILKSYAFNPSGGKDCPFLTVLNELSGGGAPTNVGTVQPLSQPAQAVKP